MRAPLRLSMSNSLTTCDSTRTPQSAQNRLLRADAVRTESASALLHAPGRQTHQRAHGTVLRRPHCRPTCGGARAAAQSTGGTSGGAAARDPDASVPALFQRPHMQKRRGKRAGMECHRFSQHSATPAVQTLARTRPCSSGPCAPQNRSKLRDPTGHACSSRGAMSVHSREHSTAALLAECPEPSRWFVLQKVNVTRGAAWRNWCLAFSSR